MPGFANRSRRNSRTPERKARPNERDIGFSNTSRTLQRPARQRRQRRIRAKDFVEPAPQQATSHTSEQVSGSGVYEADAFARIDDEHSGR